jgi:type IV pilus assembly protein PilC
MPVYVYEGRDLTGQRIAGEVDARDVQTVFNILKGRRIVPLPDRVREKNSGLNRELQLPGFSPRVSSKDVVVFTRQFATMIDSGLPIVQALEVLAKQHRNKAFKKVLVKIKETVETGGTLSQGMRKHPKVFSDLYVNMIAAGESGGILDSILERLSVYMEKALKLKRDIKTALIYPSIVVTVAFIVTAILLIFVIPTFKDLYSGSGLELPGLTRLVMSLSDFMVQWCPVIFGILGISIVVFFRALKTNLGQEIIHPIALRLPILGSLIKKVSVARFSRTLGTMLTSGVPVLDALHICGKTAGNKVVEHEVQHVRRAISEGQTMADPLNNSRIFPPMVVQMISVGEATGALDAMLNKIAEFHEQEVDTAVANLKQSIEPIMIVILGLIVGTLVIAMYLPIFQMGKVMGV